VGVRLAGPPALTIVGDPPFLRRTANGVTLALRVQPRARRTALELDKAGALRSAVTAAPEDGKANQAVIELLSREWRLPKSAFEVVKGAAARGKTIGVTGEPAALARRIGEWMKEHG
jgi:uncharacterized protein (TIGR00251 family)